MRLYKYFGSKGYEQVGSVDNTGGDILRKLNGERRAPSWKPIRVRRVRPTIRGAFRPSDSPFNAHKILIFRRSAVDALRDILDAHGELLPLEDEGGVELFAYNSRELDALDHERTVGSRDENGRVYLPDIHVFIPSVVAGIDVFRQRDYWPYVSDRFVARWKQAKLKGLDFHLAWDSDLPPEQQPNVWTSKPIKL